MRVVHVVCTANFAGVERYVSTLAADTSRRGAAVHVIGGDPALMPRALAPADVSWEPSTSVTGAVAALRRRRGDDLLHCHMTEAETAGAVVGMVRRIPLVSTRHFAARRGTTAAGRVAGALIRRRVAAQIAISAFVAARVEGACVVIPNGVPDAPVATRQEPVVLMAQRLEAEKDTATGLRAWASSGLGERGWRLEVAGEGVEAPALRALASRLGIAATCSFVGFRADIGTAMARARVLLATSPAEPFGLSVLEAMAMGLPVVATSTGAFAETVGADPAALLFAPGDADAAAARLRQLADDEAAAVEYGSRLRVLQRTRFSVAKMVEHTIDVYHSTLGDTGSNRAGGDGGSSHAGGDGW